MTIEYDPSKYKRVVPDYNKIIDELLDIFTYINQPELKELRKTNFNEYCLNVTSKYIDFCDEHYSIMEMILTGKDINTLFLMLGNFHKIKTGKMTMDQAFSQINKDIDIKYLNKNAFDKYSKFSNKNQNINNNKK